jgi:hypothetical protein
VNRSLIDDVVAAFDADDRRILVQVRSAFKDSLEAMAADRRKRFVQQHFGAPAVA